jgi:glycosyltransferase involved in cell wall biosynthesis
MTSTFVESHALRPPEAALAPTDTPRPPKPRVCFLAPTTWPMMAGSRDIPVIGGAELQQSVIAPELARRGYDVSMISMDFGQEEGSYLKGVRLIKMHKPDAGLPVVRFLHPRLTSLWAALKRADADVYYQRSSAVHTGFLAAFARAHGRKSIYAGASDVDFMPDRQDIAYARDRRIFEYGLRNVDRIFVQNPFQGKAALENFGRDSVLIPNCYETPARAQGDPNGYVLWVATVRPSKRPEILAEIARRLPQHRFMMVGGSDKDPKGKAFAEGARAAMAALPNTAVHGFLPFADADRMFEGARLVINTSTYEGFPNTFLQAWSRGVPVVSFVDTGSRHRGQPVFDLVSDVDQATAAVARLMQDDAAWEEASRRVREHFQERHSVAAVASMYEQEINRLATLRTA